MEKNKITICWVSGAHTIEKSNHKYNNRDSPSTFRWAYAKHSTSNFSVFYLYLWTQEQEMILLLSLECILGTTRIRVCNMATSVRPRTSISKTPCTTGPQHAGLANRQSPIRMDRCDQRSAATYSPSPEDVYTTLLHHAKCDWTACFS